MSTLGTSLNGHFIFRAGATTMVNLVVVIDGSFRFLLSIKIIVYDKDMDSYEYISLEYSSAPPHCLDRVRFGHHPTDYMRNRRRLPLEASNTIVGD